VAVGHGVYASFLEKPLYAAKLTYVSALRNVRCPVQHHGGGGALC
jgi:hypothetical protein